MGGKSLRRNWDASEIEKKLDEIEKRDKEPAKKQKSLDDL